MPESRDCKIETEQTGRVYKGHLFHDYYARCTVHETRSGPWHSSSEAYHYFICDPADMKFLLVQGEYASDSKKVEFTHSTEDLSGITQWLRGAYEDSVYGFCNVPEYRVYLLQSDEAITTLIPLAQRSEGGQEFNSDDYAYPHVVVYRTDTNETVTEFTVRIDGRV